MVEVTFLLGGICITQLSCLLVCRVRSARYGSCTASPKTASTGWWTDDLQLQYIVSLSHKIIGVVNIFEIIKFHPPPYKQIFVLVKIKIRRELRVLPEGRYSTFKAVRMINRSWRFWMRRRRGESMLCPDLPIGTQCITPFNPSAPRSERNIKRSFCHSPHLHLSGRDDLDGLGYLSEVYALFAFAHLAVR